jgi:septal ring factor EnvC (AmiA/AmiB activator)
MKEQMIYKILSIKKLSVCSHETFSLSFSLLLDKTKFTELESLYQELQEKYRLAEQTKSEYDLLEQQLAEERERVNELQNTINEKMIGLS